MRDPEIVGSFICYFWFITILSSQKLKNAKYSFWLQKGIKIPIWQDSLIRDPKLVRIFICYFCLKMIRTLTFFWGESCGFSLLKMFEICNFEANSFGPNPCYLKLQTHPKKVLFGLDTIKYFASFGDTTLFKIWKQKT